MPSIAVACGTAMDAYIIDDSRKLHVCGRNPDCDGYEIEKASSSSKGYEGPSIECDRCGSEMQLKNGRFGKYMVAPTTPARTPARS